MSPRARKAAHKPTMSVVLPTPLCVPAMTKALTMGIRQTSWNDSVHH